MLLEPENGYRTGKVLAHGFGPDPQSPDFTLLQGDITDAYSKKVEQVTRSFVFLNLRDHQVPAALVVFDRVVSADPAFRKYWLLHSLEEPRVRELGRDRLHASTAPRGRLTLDVMLPRPDNAQLTSRRARQGVLGVRRELRERCGAGAARTQFDGTGRLALD